MAKDRRTFHQGQAGQSDHRTLVAAPDLSDIWSKGTKGIEQLDGSGQAGAAGAKTAAAFKSNFASELQGVDALIDAAIARWAGKLGSFSASPCITPKFGAMPSASGGGGGNGGTNAAQIESLRSCRHRRRRYNMSQMNGW